MLIRKLVPNDMQEANRLFALAFEESSPLKGDGWFNPARTWGAFDEQGRLISAMVCSLLDMRFDGHWLPMGGIGGVATHPEARGKGTARAIFDQLLPVMYEEGLVFSYLFPFSEAYYRKSGYECVFQSSEWSVPIKPLSHLPQTLAAHLHLPGEPLDDFNTIYEAFVSGRNLAVRRTPDRWQERLSENPWQDKKYAYRLYNASGAPQAYFFYEAAKWSWDEGKRRLRVGEWGVAQPGALQGLLAFLGSFSAGYSTLEMYVPADLLPEMLIPEGDDVSRKLSWSGMARVVNADAALQHMRVPEGEGRFTLSVADPQLAQNSAVFQIEYGGGQLQVQRCSAEPDLAVTIQAMARLLLGTLSLGEPSTGLMPGLELRNPRPEILRAFPRKPMVILDYF